jgi:purine-binding chemotaxis protein CheW
MTESTTLEKAVKSDPAGDRAPDDTQKGEVQLLVFNLGQREFGLDVENVIEIVRQVEVTGMPEAPEYVEGIINIRETIVPLINMHRMLGIGNKTHDVNTQIIVVYGENGVIGLMVDNVSDIVTVPRRLVMNPGRCTTPLSDYVSGASDRGGALMLLLDVKKIVDRERWGEGAADPPAMVSGPEDDADPKIREKRILRRRAVELSRKNTEESSRKRRLITFSLGDELYGIDVTSVKEVSNAVETYFIPSAPGHIAGVINLRGVVVPVVDLGSFLGLKTSSDATASSIVVVEWDDVTVGLIADRVGDIVEVEAESIEPPLSTIERYKAACLEGGVEWDGKLLGILNLGNVVQINTRH